MEKPENITGPEIEARIIARQMKNKYEGRIWRRIPLSLWRDKMEGLNAFERCIFITLDTHDNEKHNCYPGRPTICSRCQITPPTADKYLNSLSLKGFVRIERKKGVENHYYLLV